MRRAPPAPGRMRWPASAAEQKLNEVTHDIIASLAEFFTKARWEQCWGRPCNKLRQAMQSVLLTAIGRAPELGGVSMARVSALVNLGSHGPQHLKQGAERAEVFLDTGLVEYLFDDRCKQRSDAIPEEQIEWLVEHCWNSDEFTRLSEKKKDEVFDPAKRAKKS